MPSVAYAADEAATEVPGDEAASVEAESVEDDSSTPDIIVTATRIRGAVDTDAPPIDELSEDDITAIGASSITDLLAAVAPQAGSGRGRGGGGPPVILLNGQRVSSFRELRDLPPEAIRQVQIFPEEVALKYGFRPDQRVVNFILKDDFASFNVEHDFEMPEKGGFTTKEFEATFTRIGKDNRLNIDTEFESSSRITEDERSILPSSASAPYALAGNVTGSGIGGEIDPALSAIAGQIVTIAGVPSSPTLAGFAANANNAANGDIGSYRTLQPSSQRFSTNATWSKLLGPQTNLSINGRFEVQDQHSLLGLPFASLAVPASNPYSPFATDVTLNRYFTEPRPLTRDVKTHTAQGGVSFNTLLADWRLALTGDYTLVDTETVTQTNGDYTDLRAGIAAGTINPFAADLGTSLLFTAPDTADSTTGTLSLRSTFSGTLFEMPAGEVQMTIRNGYDRQTIDSTASRRGVVTSVGLNRDNINSAFNVELPLLERGVGALGGIGDLSINGNMGFSDLSDFGTLIEYGAGLRWSPIEGVTVSASIIGDENAPGLGQLGNPTIVTPNVAYYDFVRGESRFIDVVSGGNPALLAESRKDLKIGLDWSPKFVEGLSLQFEYFKNKSKDTTASFPLLTPEIETAFPGRVTRDANGELIRLDQRPVNFAEERSERIRWGFNMSGPIGKQQQRGPGAGTPGGGRGPGAGGPGGGRGPMGMMPGGGPPSRWQMALYHTYRLKDEILIAPGVPVLDLLDGSATSSLGGSPQHELTLNGGVFHKGMGLRFEGTYRGATRADGSGLPGSSDLYFSDQFSLNSFLFISLDQRGDLTKKVPFLKGSRIAFRVQNVLNDYIKVRDNNGATPLSYQRGFLDPEGRVFELSFRKRF
ncbi:TonB-dependent receptor [Sphingorhabdus pulchriflava]|uniref:TonB-dependent receptor n=1 Tax=Sphingorhabdus pulchriflava TaxID=2292257 RepID=A0A371BFJ0_9SPHN|nr:TonB-dependent receptor [Sphingorhabdus pulchriflava]RDV06372.1 TonB-dependent receptor [Sphingorhabdus pulchriflava]